MAAWAGRVARRLAVVAGVSAAVLAFALLRDRWELGNALVALLLFAPAAMLVAFWLACREVVELPERLRALPGTAGENVAELRRVLRERGRHVRRTWRLLLLTRSTRELLTPYAPLVALLSPGFLALTGLAVAATLVEALAALVVLLALAL